MLMQPYGAIDLAAAAKQVSKREMGLHRVTVVFGELEKDLDGFVLLFIEQIVEATEVIGRKFADAHAGAMHGRPASRKPAAGESGRHQQNQHIENAHARADVFPLKRCRRMARRWRK